MTNWLTGKLSSRCRRASEIAIKAGSSDETRALHDECDAVFCKCRCHDRIT